MMTVIVRQSGGSEIMSTPMPSEKSLACSGQGVESVDNRQQACT